jgi:hypothetical protein
VGKEKAKSWLEAQDAAKETIDNPVLKRIKEWHLPRTKLHNRPP